MARRPKTTQSYDPSAQRPITVRQDRARWVGLGFGLLAVLIVFGVGMLLMAKMEVLDSESSAITGLGICGLVLLGCGIYGWTHVRSLDDEHYMVQKATPMPLKLAGEHDDIWTEGRIRCPRPLTAPTFGTSCSFYHYKEEEHRGSGKHSHWVTIADEKRYTAAWIEQGPIDIRLDMPKADFQYLPSANRSSGRRRYTLSYLPSFGTVSACGVVTVNERAGSPARADGPGRPRRGDGTGLLSKASWARRAEKLDRKKEQRATKMRPPRGSAAARRGYSNASDAQGEFDDDLDIAPVTSDSAREAQSDTEWRPSKPWLLTKLGTVPLMITPVPRNEWNDRAEASEVHWRMGSAVALLVGLTTFIWMAGGKAGSFPMHFDGWPIIVSGIVAAAILLPLLAIATYNRVVMYRIRVQNAWSQIDVDLKARHDLLPNVVELVKAYSAYEAETLERITQMRNQAAAVGRAARNLLQAEAQLSSLAGQLIVSIENYPDLKANTVYLNLHRQLVAIEEKISHGRSFYNEVVREYNTLVDSFPNSMVAPMLGFRQMPWWQVSDRAEREVPRVG
ncbi:MAG: LemA family protein [Planctomycetota bacterium]